jgi:hypothetical protein
MQIFCINAYKLFSANISANIVNLGYVARVSTSCDFVCKHVFSTK